MAHQGAIASPAADCQRRRLFLAGIGLAALALGSVAPSAVPAKARDAAQPPLSDALLEQLREGDLVFRQGTELVSELVRGAQGGGWSHVGMLIGQAPHWQVVHAVPAELPGRIDGVVVDTLSFFMDAALAIRIGFYRVSADSTQRRAAADFARRQGGQPFRLQSGAGGTYCTALVVDAYRAAGVSIEAVSTHLHLPLLEGDYLLPTALSVAPQLQQLQM